MNQTFKTIWNWSTFHQHFATPNILSILAVHFRF